MFLFDESILGGKYANGIIVKQYKAGKLYFIFKESSFHHFISGKLIWRNKAVQNK